VKGTLFLLPAALLFASSCAHESSGYGAAPAGAYDYGPLEECALGNLFYDASFRTRLDSPCHYRHNGYFTVDDISYPSVPNRLALVPPPHRSGSPRVVIRPTSGTRSSGSPGTSNTASGGARGHGSPAPGSPGHGSVAGSGHASAAGGSAAHSSPAASSPRR
jgi:hypothetical protein